ncbi:hypothetical protein HPP92_020908 [Vanilla planifolia]|uniref:Uncharacterized protein n=1 Tax=Vanilla planifolia TaxID=51239 RepID=A0A835Q6X2_VANPL|nr:hypothetical protein HPP92_020908 [Vanilla planifolia]
MEPKVLGDGWEIQEGIKGNQAVLIMRCSGLGHNLRLTGRTYQTAGGFGKGHEHGGFIHVLSSVMGRVEGGDFCCVSCPGWLEIPREIGREWIVSMPRHEIVVYWWRGWGGKRISVWLKMVYDDDVF